MVPLARRFRFLSVLARVGAVRGLEGLTRRSRLWARACRGLLRHRRRRRRGRRDEGNRFESEKRLRFDLRSGASVLARFPSRQLLARARETPVARCQLGLPARRDVLVLGLGSRRLGRGSETGACENHR